MSVVHMTEELPPHTRRKAVFKGYQEGAIRNYLRIRGEKLVEAAGRDSAWELPPHTRRKDVLRFRGVRPCGNYLRIRGEKPSERWETGISAELPPHTRRKDRRQAAITRHAGTTSAYAEKRLTYLRVYSPKKSKTVQTASGISTLTPYNRCEN